MLSNVDVTRPTNLAEARDAMLDAGRHRPLVIRGAGTKLEWGAPAQRCDLVVETSALNRLVAHDPADATATVQAGMPLHELQSVLATSGQWLATDPPHAGATVGGVFAANAAGPRRLRYGTMRDLVIGMTMVTADGDVARSGGKVIKNVAGYDLAKLLCGSLGTLGLVAQLVVRLHPLPAASATVTAAVSPAAAAEMALALLASPLVVSAVDWASPDEPASHGGTLAVRIEGTESGVREQTRGVADLLAARGAAPTIVDTDEESDVWRRLAERHAGSPGETVVAVATLPSAFANVAAVVDRRCTQLGMDAELTSHVGSGVHSVRLRGGDAVLHAAAVRNLRDGIGALGGHASVRRRHDGLSDPEVIWGGELSAVDLMRAVKQRFDPAARCAPGRFVGGI